jgi:hypothetical protein
MPRFDTTRLAWLIAFTVPFVPLQAQAPRPAAAAGASTWSPARLQDGQPNIEGVYVNAWTPGGSSQTRWENHPQADRDAYARRIRQLNGGPMPGYGGEWVERTKRRDVPFAVIDPADGRIPWQPWALAKHHYIRDNPYERQAFLDPRVRCVPLGATPRAYIGNSVGVQIIQPPGQVVILYEYNHMWRVVHLDGQPHPGADIQLYMGDSRGRWEGNTLVIDVTNFNDKTWVIGDNTSEGMSNGAFHSPALHLVERLTVVDPETIDYEATIEDPNVFTRPWTMRFPLFNRAAGGYEIFEYACHEGNRTLELTPLAGEKK